MKKYPKFILGLTLLVIAFSWLYVWYFDQSRLDLSQKLEKLNLAPVKTDQTVAVDITDGATYGALMAEAGVNYETTTAIYEAAKSFYDLVTIRCGRSLKLIYDKDTDKLKELVYQIDSEDELHVKNCAHTL
jgi:hypothetical protein